MTVGELIARLQHYDPALPVALTVECQGSLVPSTDAPRTMKVYRNVEADVPGKWRLETVSEVLVIGHPIDADDEG